MNTEFNCQISSTKKVIYQKNPIEKKTRFESPVICSNAPFNICKIQMIYKSLHQFYYR